MKRSVYASTFTAAARTAPGRRKQRASPSRRSTGREYRNRATCLGQFSREKMKQRLRRSGLPFRRWLSPRQPGRPLQPIRQRQLPRGPPPRKAYRWLRPPRPAKHRLCRPRLCRPRPVPDAGHRARPARLRPAKVRQVRPGQTWVDKVSVLQVRRRLLREGLFPSLGKNRALWWPHRRLPRQSQPSRPLGRSWPGLRHQAWKHARRQQRQGQPSQSLQVRKGARRPPIRAS
jgi:hypothetical protein